MRVLLITRNLPPLLGGMERLNLHIALELAQEFAVAVIGPLGCRSFLPSKIKVSEVTAKPLRRFFLGVLIRALFTAWRFQPNVVLAGSGLTAPFAWIVAKLVRARFVVYVHGLDVIADHVVYRWFWRPFICRADLCIANSNNTARLAGLIGVLESRIEIIHPGVDVPATETNTMNTFRGSFNLGNRPLLLSVGRLIARKGLLEFVEKALPQIVNECPDVCLVVLGDDGPDRLNAGNDTLLSESIRQRAIALRIENNLCFTGPQDETTLANAYRAANVHVFPGREVAGDVEGFGMVAVEAAANGLPTVAFAVGGVPDAVAEGISGNLIVADDYATMASTIVKLLKRPNNPDMRESARRFSEQFSWETFGARFRGRLAGKRTAADQTGREGEEP